MRECFASLPSSLIVLLLPLWLAPGWCLAQSKAHRRTERTSHQVELVDPTAPSTAARAYQVVLLRDRNGFPAEYALSFETHVCTDGKCLPVEVTMVWTATGHFDRLRCPPGKRLTKKDHAPFTPEDYAKLDRILKDQGSILDGWTLAFLEKPAPAADAADAVTGPTPSTVKQSVIEGAAYTSWALWHWANGPIVPQLRRITEQNGSLAYWNHLLVSGDRREADFALAVVREHHPADRRFVAGVLHLLQRGERDQITRSLEFLRRAVPDKQALHARLIEACCRMRAADCPIILQALAAEPDLPAATLEGLAERLDELPYFPVHLILRMLEQRKFASETTISHVVALLESDDFFIARRAYEYLVEQDLDPKTRNQVDAFAQHNRDRL